MKSDLDRPEALDRRSCLDLVAARTTGHLGLSMAALPVVLPVAYSFDGDRLELRTGRGDDLRLALRGAVVCLEVSDIDEDAHTGWSVLVTGTAHEVSGVAAEDEGRFLLTLDLVSSRQLLVA